MEDISVPIHCWAIVYGDAMHENSALYFLGPKEVATTWRIGLRQVVMELQRQMRQAERRTLGLKRMYLDLYYHSDVGKGQQIFFLIKISNKMNKISNFQARRHFWQFRRSAEDLRWPKELRADFRKSPTRLPAPAPRAAAPAVNSPVV